MFCFISHLAILVFFSLIKLNYERYLFDRENLAGLLPTEAKFKKRTSLFKRQPSVEEKIVKNLTVSSHQKTSTVENPLLEFMKICWHLPYYGLAVNWDFFKCFVKLRFLFFQYAYNESFI